MGQSALPSRRQENSPLVVLPGYVPSEHTAAPNRAHEERRELTRRLWSESCTSVDWQQSHCQRRPGFRCFERDVNSHVGKVRDDECIEYAPMRVG